MLLGCVLLVQKRRETAIALSWCFLIMATWLFPFQLNKFIARNFETETNCTFIDVGHGASVLLEFSNGQQLLYDAGSLVSSRFACETISNLLWSQQIEHLDAVILSHADLDHFNAMPELIERFSIGAIYISHPMLSLIHI